VLYTQARCCVCSTSWVQMLAHKFELINADDYTLNYMESKAHEGWPRSNIYKILDKIRPQVPQVSKEGNTRHRLSM
jgi:hypothetical protein